MNPLWPILRLTWPVVLPLWVGLVLVSAMVFVSSLYHDPEGSALLGAVFLALLAFTLISLVHQEFFPPLCMLPISRRGMGSAYWTLHVVLPGLVPVLGYALAAMLAPYSFTFLVDKTLWVVASVVLCGALVALGLPEAQNQSPKVRLLITIAAVLLFYVSLFAVLFDGTPRSWSTVTPGFAALLFAATGFAAWGFWRRETLIQGLYKRHRRAGWRSIAVRRARIFLSARRMVAEKALLVYAGMSLFGVFMYVSDREGDISWSGKDVLGYTLAAATCVAFFLSFPLATWLAAHWQALCLLPLRRKGLVWATQGLFLLFLLPSVISAALLSLSLGRDQGFVPLFIVLFVFSLFPGVFGLMFYHQVWWLAMVLAFPALVIMFLALPLWVFYIAPPIFWGAGHLLLRWTAARKKTVHPSSAHVWRR